MPLASQLCVLTVWEVGSGVVAGWTLWMALAGALAGKVMTPLGDGFVS